MAFYFLEPFFLELSLVVFDSNKKGENVKCLFLILDIVNCVCRERSTLTMGKDLYG